MTYTVICFETEKGRHCVKVPLAFVRQWGVPEPDDDPVRQLTDWIISEEPGPSPWKIDLPILATIDRLVSQLQTRGIGDQLGKAVQDAIQRVAADLPPGMRIQRTQMGSRAA